MWRNKICSRMCEGDWKYKYTNPLRDGFMKCKLCQNGVQHQIYWAEYGCAAGEPILYIHGGPGGGCRSVDASYFDPKRYRVILVDQRGCGKSTPSVSADDPKPGLTDNTTEHLISDFQQLKEELGINGKWHVFGGSWGSTLAMAYAIQHPEVVQNLILRGIFLVRRIDLDWFYQGNAVEFEKSGGCDMGKPGAYQFFREQWRHYVQQIPPEARHDMVKAYADVFAREPKSKEEQEYIDRCAIAWSSYEGCTAYLSQDLTDVGRFEDPAFARAFAKIENHYFMNGGFLGGKGPENRDQSYILANVERLKDIPIYITHGRYDCVCPLFAAEELVESLKKVGAKCVELRITTAGHSASCKENAKELTDFMDNLPPMA